MLSRLHSGILISVLLLAGVSIGVSWAAPDSTQGDVLADVQGTSIPDLGDTAVYTDGGRFMVSPAGNADTLSERGISIEIHVIDGFGLPVAHYPYQDIWLDDNGVVVVDNGATSPLFLPCQGGSIADADTDMDGITHIRDVISGGGWTLGGASVYVAGIQVLNGDGPDLPIEINSPDINGDRVVDVVDIGSFATDLLNYRFRSDIAPPFGVIDLVDIGRFASHIGDACP